jgi:hypothetical protein
MGSDGMKEEMQALSQQSEAVQRAAAALSAATARSRGVRLGLMVAAVLLIAVICVEFYRLGMYVQSPSYQDALLKAGQKSVADRSDKFTREFERLVEHTREPLTKAFSEQVRKDMPEFMKKAEKEKDTLAANLQEEFTKKVNSHYETLLKQQEDTLKKEFPSIQDPTTHERMIKNIDKAVQRLVKKFYVDDFRRQIDELIAGWDNFPEAKLPKPGEPSLTDQFIPALLQYAALRFSMSGLTQQVAKADSPKANLPKADTPKADSPKADSPKADTPKADTPKADSSKGSAK